VTNRSLSGTNVLDFSITFLANQAIACENAAAWLRLEGFNLDLNRNTLTFSGDGGFEIGFFEPRGQGTLVKQGNGTLVLKDPDFVGITVIDSGTVILVRSLQHSPVLFHGGLLQATGTMNTVTCSGAPSKLFRLGVGAGLLTTSNLVLNPQTTIEMELNGTIPGTNQDQIKVKGTVDLGGSLLNLSLGFTPAIGAVLTLIDNDGNDAVVGAFASLPQGTVITNSGVVLQIDYAGGDGNDVVLTRVNPPSKINSITRLSPSQILIQGAGQAGLVYTFQASTNLVNWATFGTSTANAGGVYSFVDADAASFRQRFYRVLSP
jgi:hypothetical protein